jgi:hypothetical protein
MLCSGMHSNVMHRFMVQAFQDPPLCGSTDVMTFISVPICSHVFGLELKLVCTYIF